MSRFDERRFDDASDIAFERHPRYATEHFWSLAAGAGRSPDEQAFLESLDARLQQLYLRRRLIRYMAERRELHGDTYLDRMYATDDRYGTDGKLIPPFDERRFADDSDVAYEHHERYDSPEFWDLAESMYDGLSGAERAHVASLEESARRQFYRRRAIRTLVDQQKHAGSTMLDDFFQTPDMYGPDGKYIPESGGH